MAGAKVKEFLQLIGQPDTDESVTQFLTKLTTPFEAAYFNGLYEGLNQLPDEQRATMVDAGKGAFGEFYTCSINHNRCYKVVNIEYDLLNLFKELFIQNFLSNDAIGRNHVPNIRAIYKITSKGNRFIVIEMDRLHMSLFDIFLRLTSGVKKLPYIQFYSYTKRLFILIKYLNNKYGYVHRDLKNNNIMFKLINGEHEIQLIDFGASCINITVGGTEYRIKALDSYEEAVECRSEQDVSVYLMSIVHTFGQIDKLDGNVIDFINRIFVPDYNEYIRVRMLTPDKIYTGKSLWSAYNLTGNLFTNPAYPGVAPALSLDRFLTELDRKAVELGIPAINAAAGGNHGGRRRTRHKKRKTNRRRR